MADDAPSPASVADKLHDRFRDASEKIRSRADLTAKALGGIGTTILSAVGFAKIGDVFPIPANDFTAEVAVVLLPMSFLAMAFVLGFFTFRLWRLNQPILLSSDVREMTDLHDEHERERVQSIYDQTAKLNRASSLRAYEGRAQQLARIAARSEGDARTRYLTEVSEITSDVLETQARAALVVIRERAANAVVDRKAKGFYFAFVVAVLIFAFSADKLSSAHVDEVATAKDCATINQTGVDHLPTICSAYVSVPSATTKQASSADEADDALKALVDGYAKCRRAAEAAGSGQADCELLRRAINQMTSP